MLQTTKTASHRTTAQLSSLRSSLEKRSLQESKPGPGFASRHCAITPRSNDCGTLNLFITFVDECRKFSD